MRKMIARKFWFGLRMRQETQFCDHKTIRCDERPINIILIIIDRVSSNE